LKRTFDYTAGAALNRRPQGVVRPKATGNPASAQLPSPAEEVAPTTVTEWIDRRTGIWTGVAVLFEIVPLVLVIVVLLSRIAARQRNSATASP
jgi:hypothetical protein